MSAPGGDAAAPLPIVGLRAPASGFDVAALTLVVVGLVIRGTLAGRSYLNADEALHYLLAHQASVFAAYRASLSNAHPPLLFLLLRFWTSLGSSEFFLRLPSVLAGAALPWVVYQWLATLLDRQTGLIGAILVTFSPPLIGLSAEVREYALLLLFMTAALYFLERAFQTGSLRPLALYALTHCLAILTHYSALWFTLATAAYAVARMAGRPLPRPSKTLWVAAQVGIAVLYVALYITHLSKLRGSDMEQEATGGWLHASYFVPSEGHVPGFVLRQSVALFDYLFGQREVGFVLLALVVGGSVALLVGRGAPVGSDRWRGRALGILFLSPFVVTCCAGLVRLYPYGGTRHDVFLIVFAIAAGSFCFARLAARRRWAGLLVLAAAVTISIVHGGVWTRLTGAGSEDRAHMQNAITYLRRFVPPQAFIFTDYQTSLELGYYLGKEQILPIDQPPRELMEFAFGGYRVVAPHRWMFSAQDFAAEFARLVQGYRLQQGTAVWVARIGPGPNLADELAHTGPAFRDLQHEQFGDNISIFQLTLSERAL